MKASPQFSQSFVCSNPACLYSSDFKKTQNMKTKALFNARISKWFSSLMLSMVFILSAGMAFAEEDLEIRMTGLGLSQPGDLITYNIIYYNAGTTRAANVVITHSLPLADYTYVSSSPEGIYEGNTVTWDKNTPGMGHMALLGAGAYTITVTIRAGVAGGTAGFASGYSSLGYYISTSPVTLNSTATIKSDFNTFGTTSTPAVVTTITQYCAASLNDASGKIKSATGTPVVYLVQLINNGNIYDKFIFSATNQACEGLSFDPLTWRFLDMSGNVITGTPWLAPGGSYLLLFEVSTPTGSNPFKFSCHTVKATSAVCSPSFFTSTITTEIVGSPHDPLLVLSKLDSKDPVQSGDTMTYTIYAFNSNDAYPANNFSITDILPDNVTYLSHTVTQTIPTLTSNVWNSVSKTLNLGFSSLPYGTGYAITVKINVTVNALVQFNCSGNISNTASALYTGITSPKTAAAATTITNKPDLGISKSASTIPDPASPLGTITYTLNYTNYGTCTASGVNITDIFDNLHADFLNSEPSASVTGSQISFTGLADVPPEGSGSVTYSLTIKSVSSFPDGTTTILNVASIACSQAELNYNNNTASASVYVQILPDLVVSKTVNAETGNILDVGKNYTYTVSLVNNGEINANDVIISDTLPAGLLFVSASDGGTANGSIITWPAISSLAPGSGNALTRTVIVTATCAANGLVTNCVHASSSNNDSFENDNTGFNVSYVQDNTPPEIFCPAFSPDPTTVIVDAFVGKTYVQYGTGWDATAEDNCQESDDPATVFCILSGETDAGSISSLDSISFNEGTTEVTWICTDGNNNQAVCAYNVVVNADADLSIVKSIEPPGALVIAGEELTYKIVVSNAGPSIGREIVITDNVSDIFSSAEYAFDPVNGPWYEWASNQHNVAVTIEAGETYTLYIRGTLSLYQCTTITNTATVNSFYDKVSANNSSSVTTIVQDKTLPTFTRPMDRTIYTDASCGYDISVANVGDVDNEADNCPTNIQASFVDAAPAAIPDCLGGFVIARTWSLLDDSGNAAENQVQTISVLDNTPPTFTRPIDKTIYTDASCGYDISVANVGDVDNEADNCSTEIQASFEDAAPVSIPNCQGGFSIARTWSLSDNCGNSAQNQVQTITILDNTPPTFTRPPDKTIYTEASCGYDISVTNVGDVDNEADNCSTGIQSSFVDAAPVAISNCQGGFTIARTWSLSDNCGNAAQNQVQTITILDNTPPTFTRPPDKTIYTDASCGYDISITNVGHVGNEEDNCSTGIQASFVDSAPVAIPNCLGGFTIARSWSLSDYCGNAAQNQVQTITILDNTPPTFTRPIDKTIHTDASCGYDISVANVGDVDNEADNCSTGIQASFEDAAPVAMSNCFGGFTISRTWSLSDYCGNAAQNQVQTITILDNTPPTFTRPPDKTIYTDASCGYDISLANVGDVDNEADNCSTGIQASFADAAPVAIPNCLGGFTIARTWSLSDNCGNAAQNQVQTITILDNTPPTFTHPPDKTIYTDVNCGYDITIANLGDVANEADNCSTGIQASFVDAAPVAIPNCLGGLTIARTWSLSDNCGNSAQNQVQTITILDNIAPTFTRPEDITIYRNASCIYNSNVAVTGDVINEADNCSTGLQATYSDVINNSDPCNVIISRTWHLVDNCGNAAANQVQTITVKDNIGPTFTRPPDITIYRNAGCTYNASVSAAGDVTNEADNCTVGQATYSDAINSSDPCNLIITRTWHLADNCGNIAPDQVQTITVRDNSAPTFTRPSNITIYKDASCNYNASVAFTGDVLNEADNCSAGLQATFNDEVNSSNPCNVVISRTWQLVDNCGNAAANQVQTISIMDNTPPTLLAPDDVIIPKDANCEADIDPSVTGYPSSMDNCDPDPLLSYTDESCYSTDVIGQMNHGVGYYYPVVISGFDEATASQLHKVYMSFTTQKGKGNVEFTLIAPSGDGVILIGPYCNGGECDNLLNMTNYSPSFYPNSSGYTKWINSSYITAGAGSFTPYGGISEVNTIADIDYLERYVSKIEDLTGPMNGTWILYGRKWGTATGTMSFDGICLTPLDCEADALIVRNWIATDACGNVTAPYRQTINIKDLTPPAWITVSGSLDRQIQYGDAAALAAAQLLFPVAGDNCDNDVTNIIKTPGSFVAGYPCSHGGTYTNSWTVNDGCGNASAGFSQVITIVDNHNVSGVITYYNIYNTPMDMVNLSLYRESSVIASTTTSSNGYYEFNNLPDGTYRIEPSVTKPSGGVNSLDAGQVNYWWTHLSTIENVRWDAGNFVYSDNFINATDAGSIQSYFVNGTPLPSPGYWTIYKAQITSDQNPPASQKTFEICGNHLVQDFYALCVGDFTGTLSLLQEINLLWPQPCN